MRTLFLDVDHKEKMKTMIKVDQTHLGDCERLTLFYIISGNWDLYNKRNLLYNAKNHTINLEFEESNVDFSSGMKSLIKLGYNLYNGWSDDYTTPIDIFCSFDEGNFKLADMAMKIRFNQNLLKELQKEILI